LIGGEGSGLLLDKSEEARNVVFGRRSGMDIDLAFRIKQFHALHGGGMGDSVVTTLLVV